MAEALPPMIPDAGDGAIIRRLDYRSETSNERLLKKHLPAWVISGALNLGIMSGFIITDKINTKAAAKPSDSVIETSLEEKPDDANPKDLSNPDPGLDSEIPHVTPSEIIAAVTIEAPDAINEPIGTPAAKETAPMDFTAPPGIGPIDLTNAGHLGDMGMLAQGTGGLQGNVVNPGMLGRSGATKDKMIREGGGNAESERAVALALVWLAKQQRPNGSFIYDGSKSDDTVSATGMGLLPFLAAGQTHRPNNARTDYHLVVNRGLDYLIANQDPITGKLRPKDEPGATDMYGHAVATIALCEAYGMTGDKAKLFAPTQRAINYIQREQGSDGSWGYSGKSGFAKVGDTSIVGWQIQALKSAQMCKDLVVEKEVLSRARQFLQRISAGPNQDKYGYSLANPRKPEPGTALTAVGLLCRYYLDGWGPENPGMALGVEGLLKSGGYPGLEPFQPNNVNMYYYYYATQVLHFHGGKEWTEKWNPMMRDMLIKSQKKDGPNGGSWDPGADREWMGPNTGRLGVTCMSLLTLEVYYRHLPLYKRDMAGMKELERIK
ncbi:MAG: prenyltransferase/squalene oxidase repeat-containing protein [Gemmataceae bacterium]